MRRPSRSTHGFALMIAVVSVTLIGLALAVIVRVGPLELRARAIRATEQRLDEIAGALELWVLDAGAPPTSLSQLLTTQHMGPYVYDLIEGESILEDAFHNSLVYRIVDAATLQIQSDGPDHVGGTADDLTRTVDIGGLLGQLTKQRLSLVNAAIDAYYQRNGKTAFVAGLTATYHDADDWTGTTATKIEPSLDFAWTNPYPVGTNGIFSAEWRGYITPPASTTYTFYVTAYDGAWLYIDDRLIVNASAGGSFSGTMRVTGGQPLPIYVKYWNSAGSPQLKLEWSSSSLSKQVISSQYLKTEIAALLDTIAEAKTALYDEDLLPLDESLWEDAWGDAMIVDPRYPDGVEQVASVHVTLPADQITTDLSGILYHDDGSVAGGAQIELQTGIGDTTVTTITDAAGRFLFADVTVDRLDAALIASLGDNYGVIRGFTPIEGGSTEIRFFLSEATNVALGRPVIVEGPLEKGLPYFPNWDPVVVTDGYMQDTSLGLYNSTNIWWYTTNFVRIDVDLEQTRLVVGVIIMVHNNDEYILEYRDPLTQQWHLLWDISIVDPAPNPGWLWPVRPNHYDWDQQYPVGPLYADRVRLYARSDNTAWCGVNEIMIFGY